MERSDGTYKKIIKATSVFGSIQLISLAVSLIRSKVLAILIGPSGYGLFYLLNSTVDMVRQLSGFSIETSGVKSISEAKVHNNPHLINKTSSVLLIISAFTGIFGVFLTLIFSKPLSFLAFKSNEGIWAIAFISISIFFRQITSAQSAVMQGGSKLKYLAATNLYSNLFSLIFTLPLYFFLGINAIVPAIILSSIVGFLISSFFYKKMGIKYYKLTLPQAFKSGKKVLYFGGLLSASAFLPSLVNYCLQIFINKNDGLSGVGLFNVTLVMINSYVGIIFSAMATEYYPRLVSLNKNYIEETKAVNAQAILSMLIIVPVIIFFLGFSSIIIKSFFSIEFLNVIPLLSWAIVGMFFKAVSFSMGYVIIARTDSAVFTKTAVVFNALYFVICLSGYYLNGLEGLGTGICAYFLLHLISIYILIKLRYSINLSTEFYYIFIAGFLFCACSLVLYNVLEGKLKLIIFSILFVISGLFSLREINKRIALKDMIMRFFKRQKDE